MDSAKSLDDIYTNHLGTLSVYDHHVASIGEGSGYGFKEKFRADKVENIFTFSATQAVTPLEGIQSFLDDMSRFFTLKSFDTTKLGDSKYKSIKEVYPDLWEKIISGNFMQGFPSEYGQFIDDIVIAEEAVSTEGSFFLDKFLFGIGSDGKAAFPYDFDALLAKQSIVSRTHSFAPIELLAKLERSYNSGLRPSKFSIFVEYVDFGAAKFSDIYDVIPHSSIGDLPIEEIWANVVLYANNGVYTRIGDFTDEIVEEFIDANGDTIIVRYKNLAEYYAYNFKLPDVFIDGIISGNGIVIENGIPNITYSFVQGGYDRNVGLFNYLDQHTTQQGLVPYRSDAASALLRSQIDDYTKVINKLFATATFNYLLDWGAFFRDLYGFFYVKAIHPLVTFFKRL